MKSISLEILLTDNSPHMTMMMPTVTVDRQIMGAQAILPKSNGPIKNFSKWSSRDQRRGVKIVLRLMGLQGALTKLSRLLYI